MVVFGGRKGLHCVYRETSIEGRVCVSVFVCYGVELWEGVGGFYNRRGWRDEGVVACNGES